MTVGENVAFDVDALADDPLRRKAAIVDHGRNRSDHHARLRRRRRGFAACRVGPPPDGSRPRRAIKPRLSRRQAKFGTFVESRNRLERVEIAKRSTSLATRFRRQNRVRIEKTNGRIVPQPCVRAIDAQQNGHISTGACGLQQAFRAGTLRRYKIVEAPDGRRKRVDVSVGRIRHETRGHHHAGAGDRREREPSAAGNK
jgi:hypothetical protein